MATQYCYALFIQDKKLPIIQINSYSPIINIIPVTYFIKNINKRKKK